MKILVVATYPIKNPQHGGQKRADAIVTNYKAHFSSVKFVAVFAKDFYKNHSSSDIAVSFESERLIGNSPLTGDIICGQAILRDQKVKRKFTKLLREYNPDIIHIEQPFAYLGLKPLLNELGMNPKIIFGSQNIEAPMKREILKNARVPEADIAVAENLINDLEHELSRKCDLLVACTKSDLALHKEMGATRTVLAPKGVTLPQINSSDIERWQQIFQNKGIKNSVLFVGSAHPPNWVGFLDIVGKGLGFIPTDCRIVLAGSICDYFEKEITDKNLEIEDATFWLRAYSAGRLTEKRLVALIQASETIILPITEGGGSNLKTAEAIIANKKVVATSHALRSFEWFKDYPNVWVADTKEDFQDAIIDSLGVGFVERTPEQVEKARYVLWGHCLSTLIEEAKQL